MLSSSAARARSSSTPASWTWRRTRADPPGGRRIRGGRGVLPPAGARGGGRGGGGAAVRGLGVGGGAGARGAPRPPLTAQTAALLGYGGLAVATLFVVPTTAGLLLAGLVLASHGVWDIVHWWRDRVVSRSLAEFCVMLGIPLGLGAVAGGIPS